MLQSKNEQHKNNGGIELINSRNKRIQDSNENWDEEQNEFNYLDNEATEPGTNPKENDETIFENINDVKINETQKESVKGEDIILEVKQECEQNKEEIIDSPCHIKKKKKKKKKEKGQRKKVKKKKNMNHFTNQNLIQMSLRSLQF